MSVAKAIGGTYGLFAVYVHVGGLYLNWALCYKALLSATYMCMYMIVQYLHTDCEHRC